MLQYGLCNNGGDEKNVYLSNSYYDTNYSVITNSVYSPTTDLYLSAAMVSAKTTTSFKVVHRHISWNGEIYTSNWNFYWIALGRWK